jgi:hypothetical protein
MSYNINKKQYNLLGQVSATSSPSVNGTTGVWTNYGYDWAGRQISKTILMPGATEINI